MVAVLVAEVEVIIQRPLLVVVGAPVAPVKGAAWVTVILHVPLVFVGAVAVPTAAAKVKVVLAVVIVYAEKAIARVAARMMNFI